MDPTMRAIPGAAPVIPGAAAAPAPAVPEAGGAAPVAPAGPGLAGDAATAAADVQFNVTQVNIEGIDLQEMQALDGMLQNFMQDGKLTKEEFATYDKTRVFYAGGAKPHTPAPTAPTGGGPAPTTTPAPTTPTAPTPPALPWEVGSSNANGLTFSSVGDPHETTGDGGKFDNMKVGDFVKLASASGDFMLQTRQEPWSKNPKATVNTEAAVKMGKDVVAYNGKTGTLTVNGQPRTLKPGEEIALPDGGKVKMGNGSVDLTSPKGDTINIKDMGEYIDVTGKMSDTRKDGEIRGSLGAMDADTGAQNDMLGRSGNTPIGDLDKFLEEWRVKPGEGLIAGDPPGGSAKSEAELAAIRADEKEFNDADITKGGWLSGTEVKAEYKKYDQNNDGEISKDEFMSGRNTEREAERDFMLKNINNDGYLDGNEITNDIKKYDKDGNGRLTKEEFIAGRLADRKVGPVNTGGAGGANPGGGGATAPNGGAGGPGGAEPNNYWAQYMKQRFEARDKDNDGTLSRKELGKKKFKAYDTNNDGKVTEQEFTAGRKKDFSKWMNKRDINNDGILSGNEISKRLKKRDANGDGRITKEEYLQGAAKERLDAAKAREVRAEKAKIQARKFKAMDVNNDGQVSRQEFMRAQRNAAAAK